MTPQELLTTVWSGIVDILQFRVFVSPSVLLVTYYLGAALIPVLLFIAFRRLSGAIDKHLVSWQALTDLILFVTDRPLRLALFAVVMFLGAELLWRMMFEFILAYFQMRDALIDR